MPTYEYKREDGTIFEIKQRITADPLKECPETGQEVTRIISSNVSFDFKGTGFHSTDYTDHGPENPDYLEARDNNTE